MSNTICIKRGSTVPTLSQLESYELGYVNNGELYIRETIKDTSGTTTSDKIIQLTGLAATGLVNDNNYLKLPTIIATDSSSDKIMVVGEDNVVYYRTKANILNDIEALPLAGGTVTGATTFNSTLTANGALIVKEGISYGTSKPNDADGQEGQLFFVLVEEE